MLFSRCSNCQSMVAITESCECGGESLSTTTDFVKEFVQLCNKHRVLLSPERCQSEGPSVENGTYLATYSPEFYSETEWETLLNNYSVQIEVN